MTSPQTHQVLDRLHNLTGCKPKETVDGWVSHCPAHGSHLPELIVSEGTNAQPVFHCREQCAEKVIRESLGLPVTEVAPKLAAETTTDEWPEINSFDQLNLPDFPTNVLPDGLRQWVDAESHATQTPADLAGLLSLAVCSAVIARRVVVEPCDGWREPVNLYVAVLMEPGSRKSAVFADAKRPLAELEAELIAAARPEVSRKKTRFRQNEARLKKLEKDAAEKGDAQAIDEADKLAEKMAELDEPVLPRLVVDDSTSEKLAMIMAEQCGRIASMSPEGGVFDLMAGQYSKSGLPQFGVYLMAHSGDDIITDRVSRKSVLVKRPALTCAYAMQPIVLKTIAGNAAFRGRGLLARFLYAAPHSLIGNRAIAATPVSKAKHESYREIVRGLAEINGEFTLKLTTEALKSLRAWESEIEPSLGDGGEMETLRDWGGKLAGETLRLAAVLHCVEFGATGLLGMQTLEAAIEIARYLVPHAFAVLSGMDATEESASDDACYVLRWIKRHSLREFTQRDAQQNGKRRFRKPDDIIPALDELVQRGYTRKIAPEPKGKGPGRSSSPRYEVNPAVFETKKPENRSYKSLDATSDSESGNCENSENGSASSESVDRVQVTI